ncbi:MAG TPA: glycosyltransferase family 2 protein [Solirubrobacteraceae bacterium]
MRIVAMLQVYNERRFIAGCIEHLHEQGVGVYVIDNESSDDTLQIAERYEGRGVVGIETLPRDGTFALNPQCERQEQLARTLDADWLMHHDADEIRVSPTRGQTLAEAIAEVDEAGFNAVNFFEFTFLPVRESPDHDHPDFQRTMHWYYPFLPWFPARLNAWKRQDGPIDLTTMGGHQVKFEGLAMAPESLYMRHYLYLSAEHAREKFLQRRYSAKEVDEGFHGWRAKVQEQHIELPSESEVPGRYEYGDDHLLDPSNPFKHHLMEPAKEKPTGLRARGRRALRSLRS